MNITEEMAAVKQKLQDYLANSTYLNTILSTDLKEAVQSYLEAGGKYLRPCLLLWSCRALGGDEDKALPAALAT